MYIFSLKTNLGNFCFHPWQSNLYQFNPPAKNNYKTEQNVQDNFFQALKNSRWRTASPEKLTSSWAQLSSVFLSCHWAGRWSQVEWQSQWLVSIVTGPNICGIGIWEREEIENGVENIFEDVMAKKFPNFKGPINL